MYSLVASAINHPDQLNQLWGVFNHRSLTSLSRNGVSVYALVPRPRAPPVGPYSQFRSIPEQDGSFAYPVRHPRFWYYVPKSLWYHRSGDSMAGALGRWLSDSSVRPDIYHGCHLYPDGYALSTLAETSETPLTAYAHGTVLNSYADFNEKTQSRIRQTLGQARTVFCSGEDIEQKVQTLDSEVTTEVVPIGADPENFPTDRLSALRSELNVPSEATVVLFCGHFSPEKGVEDLVEIFERLSTDSLYFVCIGHGGSLRADLQQALGGRDPPHGTVLWKLHPVAVRRWFAVADLFVLPSYSEGRPTVIYEAMASRTPVLATTVGGIPEQVEPDRTGWTVEPGNVSAFVARIQDTTREQLREMGVAAEKRLLEQGWTWEAHATRLMDAHRRLLETDDT